MRRGGCYEFFKSLLYLILFIAVAACNSGDQPNASSPLNVTDAISGPKDLPNHKKYRDFIKIPLRDLKVTEEMTLVDNFADVLRYHRAHQRQSSRERWNGRAIFFNDKL